MDGRQTGTPDGPLSNFRRVARFGRDPGREIWGRETRVARSRDWRPLSSEGTSRRAKGEGSTQAASCEALRARTSCC